MSPRFSPHPIRYFALILTLLILLSCNISVPGQEGDSLSTSVAQTVEAGNIQLTMQAQQVQLTAVAQTLAAPPIPVQTEPPVQPEQVEPPQPPTPEPKATATTQSPAQATAEVVSSFLANLGINASPELTFGPESGALEHDPNDGSTTYACAGVNTDNFLLHVDFSPPFSGDTGAWDFGFIFRVGDKGSLRLILLHDKNWEFENYSAASDKEIPISKGEVPSLNTNAGDKNQVKLVATNSQGWLFVNDQQVSKLDLSSLTDSGEVCIALGFYKNTEKAGAATEYSDFTVWELK